MMDPKRGRAILLALGRSRTKSMFMIAVGRRQTLLPGENGGVLSPFHPITLSPLGLAFRRYLSYHAGTSGLLIAAQPGEIEIQARLLRQCEQPPELFERRLVRPVFSHRRQRYWNNGPGQGSEFTVRLPALNGATTRRK
jgi:hypothetical protein